MSRRKARTKRTLFFDPRLGTTGRYTNTKGQIVSVDVVQAGIEQQIESSAQIMGSAAKRFHEGKINIAELQIAMKDEMKLLHTRCAAIAKGGWKQMSQADWGSVGQITRIQYKTLENFMAEIANGDYKISKLDGSINGQFLQRVDLYAEAGNGTAKEIERRQAKLNGLTHERRILDPAAKHCGCCLSQAALNWQLFGILKRLGECDCRSRDRCHFIFGAERNGKISEGKR